MNSISLVCGSNPNDGIFRSSLPLYEVLRSEGYDARWYQCQDGGRDIMGGLPPGSSVIHGTGALGKTLSMGFNRLFLFPRRLRDLQGDVIHLLDPTLIGVSRRPDQTVATVHDLRALTEYSDKFATKLMFRHIIPSINGLKGVLVTTNYMKTMLLENGVEKPDIYVVPHASLLGGTGRRHLEQSAARIEEERRMRILYVATDRPYKNVDFFLDIASKLLKKNDSISFHFDLVTKPTRQTVRKAAGLPPSGFSMHTSLSDRELEVLYSESDLLLFPSMYEGFGLPLLEAMSFGIPIISNNINPMIEVLGESASLIGVGRIDDWVGMIEKLTSPREYNAAALKSLERYSFYSRERFRERVLSTFSQITSG